MNLRRPSKENILGRSVKPMSLFNNDESLSGVADADFAHKSPEWTSSTNDRKSVHSLPSQLFAKHVRNLTMSSPSAAFNFTGRPIISPSPQNLVAGKKKKKIFFSPTPVVPLLSGPTVWGVGEDGRVWKWGGSAIIIDNKAWYEPNPAAGARQVDLGLTTSGNNTGNAMAVGPNGRVYKWNNSKGWWEEPWPYLGLKQISHVYWDFAWGISTFPTVFRLWNNGVWQIQYNAPPLTQISTGGDQYVYGITSDARIFRFDGSSWSEPNKNAGAYYICGAWANTVWALGADNAYPNGGKRIFRSDDWGEHWDEPNPNAGLLQISAINEYWAWGVGYGGRVFQTIDGGLSWHEPNSGARLAQVSIGYED